MAQIPTRGISGFKSKLIGGGARPNLFEVDVTFPTAVNLGVQGDGGTGHLILKTSDFSAKLQHFLVQMLPLSKFLSEVAL